MGWNGHADRAPIKRILHRERRTVNLTQEATLRAFFKQDGGLARGTGFLARFLIAWPESTQGFRPFTEAPENWPHLAAFNRRIAEILNLSSPIDDGGALHPAMLPMSPDAKDAEQPTRLQFLRGESPLTVNCPVRTVSIPGARGGNEPRYVRA